MRLCPCAHYFGAADRMSQLLLQEPGACHDMLDSPRLSILYVADGDCPFIVSAPKRLLDVSIPNSRASALTFQLPIITEPSKDGNVAQVYV